MALGPIPYTAILIWCEFERLDHEATVLMKTVIRQLDNDRAEREASKQRLKNLSGGK